MDKTNNKHGGRETGQLDVFHQSRRGVKVKIVGYGRGARGGTDLDNKLRES